MYRERTARQSKKDNAWQRAHRQDERLQADAMQEMHTTTTDMRDVQEELAAKAKLGGEIIA